MNPEATDGRRKYPPMNLEPKVPPYDLNAEKSVLGALLLSNYAFYEVSLSAEDFYKAVHQKIFTAIQSLLDKGEPVDFTTIYHHFFQNGGLESVGGGVYLSQLLDAVPTAANIRSYAKIVKDMSIRRQILIKFGEVGQKIYSDPEIETESLLADVEDTVYSLGLGSGGKKSESIFNLLKKTIEGIEILFNNPNKVSGISTGLCDLDEWTGGLIKSDLTIVAARPSLGKTSLALTIADNVCKAGGSVLLFSLEMSKDQLCKRFLSGIGQVDSKKFRTGNLNKTDWLAITGAAGNMSEYKLLINDDSDINLRGIRSGIMNAVSRGPLDLVIVDYLQLINSDDRRKNQNREQEIAGMSRGLKRIAKKFDVPVMALCQLNRGCELRTNKRPMLSDLRESGAIEQDADNVFMIYRDIVYNEKTDDPTKAEIIIRKQRNGPCRTIFTRFIEEYSVFRNYAGREL